MKKPKFKVGQWVRVKKGVLAPAKIVKVAEFCNGYGYLVERLRHKKVYKTYTASVVEYSDLLAEEALELAAPKAWDQELI